MKKFIPLLPIIILLATCVSAVNFGTGASFVSITGNAVKTLPAISHSKAPASWTFNVPQGAKVYVTTHSSAGIDAYGGYNAYVKINGQKVWKNTPKQTIDYAKNKKYAVNARKGRGKWLDVTKFTRPGRNKITYYHYTGDGNFGVKIKMSGGAKSAPKTTAKKSTARKTTPSKKKSYVAPTKAIEKPASYRKCKPHYVCRGHKLTKIDSDCKESTVRPCDYKCERGMCIPKPKITEKEKEEQEKRKVLAKQKAKEERYQKHLAEKKRLEELRKPKKICSPAWKCREKDGKSYREYQKADCSWGGTIVWCKKGCNPVLGGQTNRICNEEIEEDREKERAEADRKRKEIQEKREEAERKKIEEQRKRQEEERKRFEAQQKALPKVPAKAKAVEKPKTCAAKYICKYYASNKAYIEVYQDKNCNIQPIRTCKHGCDSKTGHCKPAPKPKPLPPMEISKDVEYIQGGTIRICKVEQKCEGKKIIKIAKDCKKTVVKTCDQKCVNGACKCISSYFCLDARTSARRGTDCRINKKIKCETGCNQEIGLCYEKPRIWCDSKDERKVLIKDKHGNTRSEYCKSNEKCSDGRCVKQCRPGWNCERGYEVYYDDYCRATKRTSCGNRACNTNTGRCSPKPKPRTCELRNICRGSTLVRVNRDCTETGLRHCRYGCAMGRCSEAPLPPETITPTPPTPTPPAPAPAKNYCIHNGNRYGIGASVCVTEGGTDYAKTCNEHGYWSSTNCNNGCIAKKGKCRADWCKPFDIYIWPHPDCA